MSFRYALSMGSILSVDESSDELLAVVLFVGGSLLILASLLCLRVHWLLVIAVLLLALLTPYGEGRLFPTDPASWATTWFLTYGAVVVVLSLLLLGRRKGVWLALWRTLLVTGASAAMMACAPLCQLVLSRHPGPLWSPRQEAVRRLPYPECRCKNSKVVWLNSSTFSYSGVWAHPSKITNSACWMFCFIRSAKRVEVTRS